MKTASWRLGMALAGVVGAAIYVVVGGAGASAGDAAASSQGLSMAAGVPSASGIRPDVDHPLKPAGPVAGLPTTAYLPPSLMDDLWARSQLAEPWLEAHGFVPGTVALTRLHALLDGRNPLAPGAASPTTLAFGPTADSTSSAAGNPRLASQERYIQAALTGLAGAGDSVIVRWYVPGQESVIELSAQPLPSNPQEALKLWRHSAEDWSPGHYRVEVVSADADLRLLASGEFEVVPPGVAVTPFSHPVSATSKP
jgi:hypothetical protein